jgi:8-oxo-dGTP pyrophosphatase MutT (NUDIX family)
MNGNSVPTDVQGMSLKEAQGLSCECGKSICALEKTHERMISKEAIPLKQLTLAFATREGQLLLGMKRRGFGVGKYNGFGGKIDPGESVVQGAIREMLEESGLLMEKPRYRGQLWFQFVNKDEVLVVHVFVCDSFSGEAKETEEMTPKWFDFAEIPFDDMWPDDRIWLMDCLQGTQSFLWYFLFDGHDKFETPCYRNLPHQELPLVQLDPHALLVHQQQTSMGVSYGR